MLGDVCFSGSSCFLSRGLGWYLAVGGADSGGDGDYWSDFLQCGQKNSGIGDLGYVRDRDTALGAFYAWCVALAGGGLEVMVSNFVD